MLRKPFFFLIQVNKLESFGLVYLYLEDGVAAESFDGHQGHWTKLNWGLINTWKSPQVFLEVKMLGDKSEEYY